MRYNKSQLQKKYFDQNFGTYPNTFTMNDRKIYNLSQGFFWLKQPAKEKIAKIVSVTKKPKKNLVKTLYIQHIKPKNRQIYL